MGQQRSKEAAADLQSDMSIADRWISWTDGLQSCRWAISLGTSNSRMSELTPRGSSSINFMASEPRWAGLISDVQQCRGLRL